MACEYCGKYLNHHPRCPLYKPKSNHYCSICENGIFNGEEYIENANSEFAHWDCFPGRRDLLEWLGYEIKTMEDDDY